MSIKSVDPTDYPYIAPVDNDSRLGQLILLHCRLSRDTTPGLHWGALFQTTKHRRREALVAKVRYHISWYLSRKLPGITRWSLDIRDTHYNPKIQVIYRLAKTL